MQKRVRCPVCGMVVWRSQVEKSHNIDILEMNRVVRAKGSGGFKYNKSSDVGLVALVRAKIKALYDKYFEPAKLVALAPGIQSRGGLGLSGGVILRPGISTVPVVSAYE